MIFSVDRLAGSEKPKSAAFVIFSGFNQRAVIAFLRTLELNDLQYAIIASSVDDTIFLTKYKKNVLAVRETITLDLNDILECISVVQDKLKADDYIVAPSSEALNRFLLKNREIFTGNKCKIPLASKELYEKISDKYEFQKICIQNNILVPNEFKGIKKAVVPYVAKPKTYFSNDGSVHSPLLVLSRKRHQEFTRNFEKDDFYYQEFVSGKSIYLLYYFCKDETVYKFSQENYIQQPCGKSILAAVPSDYHRKDESLKYEKMFKNLKFNGLVMVELREHQNQCYFIEANPRFWGPSQLFVDAGLNLFEAFLYDLKIVDKGPVFKEPIGTARYFWFGGFAKDAQGGEDGIAYHNYTSDAYANEFVDWQKSDVYHREDTHELYKEELKL